jgi:hypothetical protein
MGNAMGNANGVDACWDLGTALCTGGGLIPVVSILGFF